MRELRGTGLAIDVELAINELIRGRTNATGSVTLDANATQTTLSDSRLTENSVLLLIPETATAAAEFGSLYVNSYAKGSCVIHHNNTADTDKTFRFVILTGS